MTVRMLIDATHAEETRVVVVRGNRLEAFDYESASKRQLKGNIYLAKVTRVEPSLQAAFVEYGGNRHGFLSFNEIHPDYYQIPIEDREALLEEEARSADDEIAAEEAEVAAEALAAEAAEDEAVAEAAEDEAIAEEAEDTGVEETGDVGAASEAAKVDDGPEDDAEGVGEADGETIDESAVAVETAEDVDADTEEEEVGEGDAMDEVPRRRPQRRYKIQEVIKRRQILLVQVVKEERGNKGAALTTYLSLAGRYCVLMPNTARGGGISRKITNQVARKKLKTIVSDLDLPEGMGVIVRTAGMSRTKTEIKRDFEYMLRAWERVREETLASTAPALVYEEANLITRVIRDLYNKEVEEILVEGEGGYRIAKDFMRTMQPSHAKRVQHYKEHVPLLHRYQVEQQLDQMHSNVVQLKSGGYLVINPTEALVAIDVNSGRSTREHHIEETALKTNLEASDEVARQLRLRDLAGLIVIDYIDMSENRNNRAVERRLKECLKPDRARLQVGRISGFGLLEMSRQRLRTSLFEASTVPCEICGGSGHVRSTESTALHLLRAIEDEGIRGRSARVTLTAPTTVALYVLNQKRDALAEIEQRYDMVVALIGDDSLVPPNFALSVDQGRDGEEGEAPGRSARADERDGEAEGEGRKRRRRRHKSEDGEAETPRESAGSDGEVEGDGRKRRRRRRRRAEEDEVEVEVEVEATEVPEGTADAADAEEGDGASEDGEGAGTRRRRRRAEEDEVEVEVEVEATEVPEGTADAADAEEGDGASEDGEGAGTRRRRRRGRRGGKRRRDEALAETEAGAEETAPVDAAEIVAAAVETEAEAPAREVEDQPDAEAEPVEAEGAPEVEEFEAKPEAAPALETKVAEAEPVEAEAVPEVEAEVVEVSEATPEPAPEPEPLVAEAEEAPAVAEPEAPGAPVAEPDSDDEAEADDRPKRRGWWRR